MGYKHIRHGDSTGLKTAALLAGVDQTWTLWSAREHHLHEGSTGSNHCKPLHCGGFYASLVVSPHMGPALYEMEKASEVDVGSHRAIQYLVGGLFIVFGATAMVEGVAYASSSI